MPVMVVIMKDEAADVARSDSLPLSVGLPRWRQIGLNAAGVAGVGFFLLYLVRGIPDERALSSLWACHLASLLAGAGILFRRPAIIGVGVLWLFVGIPLWLVYLSLGGQFRPESAFTHLGGLAVGLCGLQHFGMPRRLWWRAIVGMWGLLIVSRLGLPPEQNVNLAFHCYQPTLPTTGFHLLCLGALTGVATVALLIAERGLRLLFPRPTMPSG